MAKVEFRRLEYGDPVVQRLVGDAMADLGARYGGDGDESPIDVADFRPPRGAFLVAFLDGVPVACGAWRSHGDDGELAELKRMYTAPHARGRGVARQVLAAVEESARAHGRRRMILECGDRQPEAIALYQACGYERIEDFGFYRGHPGVRSFGRDL
ncbi:MAG TPA: GNAT family N-acetyltransferase [Pilimelia sp.]|nr:GNAT family N-acetyltransferase [Pilimelia sp.]